jgi:hypothetical protein
MPLYVNKVSGDATQVPGQWFATSTARLAPIVEWILFALMVEYLGIHTLPAAWKTLNTDFANYYLTARLARDKNDTSIIYDGYGNSRLVAVAKPTSPETRCFGDGIKRSA